MSASVINGHPDHDSCGTGFIMQLGKPASHEVVDRALAALHRLSHRGGVDADGASGDGAGLLTDIPQKFIRRAAAELDISLPSQFGLGMLFLEPDEAGHSRGTIEALAPSMGLQFLGWREVPVNSSVPGSRAAESLPAIWQCFFAESGERGDFELRLFLFRKRVEAELGSSIYFCSLSSRTVVYKGLLAPWQLPIFYPELHDHDFESRFAVFHQRFSTNTQPAWSLAQPFRFLAHNGEINTIVGNRRWMCAREEQIRTALNAGAWFHGLEENVSDSASLDNALELLVHQGRSAEGGLLTLVPPVCEGNSHLGPEVQRYLESAAAESEPWDGPAALIFSDGRVVGAKLDRNGLRPLRYTRTSDGWLVAGSEAGIAALDERKIIERQRLGPGEMLMVGLDTGRISRGNDLLRRISMRTPQQSARPINCLPPGMGGNGAAISDPQKIAASLGWTADQLRYLLQPLADGKEAVWSMGDDTPPAFMSKLRRSIWDYCKQRFAQVTNPPIDPLREAYVMSLKTRIGELSSESPLLGGQELLFVQDCLKPCLHIDVTFDASAGVAGAVQAMDRIRKQVRWDRRNGEVAPKLIVLSDRNVSSERAALPILLAAAAVWQDMAGAGNFHIPLVVETAQAFDTHHVALLLAVGASAVCPFLAQQLAQEHNSDGAANHRIAVNAGLRKVLSRMGISTLSSYRNAQLFEVVGLDGQLCREFFTNADRFAEATSIEEVFADYLHNHEVAFAPDHKGPKDAGLYRYRKEGEIHGTSPELMRRMQTFLKKEGVEAAESYQHYEELGSTREPAVVRDLLTINFKNPIDISQVEPEAKRFGVTTEYLVHAEEIEIKMAQGSKPGEGGQLPAIKVSPYIARLRRAVPGMSLISPPPHHDIYSIEDLEQLIHDLREVNPQARIGVKLVAGAGVGIIAAGVAKAGADVITISGHDGGTGASPLSSIKNTGLPWEFGLRSAHRTLVETGLRRHVRLRVDGGFKFARDVIIAALLGADEFGFGTAALLAMGCVMARQCHLNTCPVGIATQDEALRARFTGKPEMVISYFQGVASEVRALLGRLGVNTLEEIIGHAGYLQPRNQESAAWVADLLRPPSRSPNTPRAARDTEGLAHELTRIVGNRPAAVACRFPIVNADRSIGARLSGDLVRRRGTSTIESTPIDLDFHGAAGQSFGAFLASGISFHLSGEANDYVGKGLSGGTIAIDAGPEASLRGDVLVGNTVLYGATSGELYVAGKAGERFAVRNSGALAVVEGVGDHGCEYMTGGVVLVLGTTGVNFGSGMTGGLAYMLADEIARHRFHPDFVQAVVCSAEEDAMLRQVLIKHCLVTGSPTAALLLNAGPVLPFMRLQPLQLPCTVDQTWAPALRRLRNFAPTGGVNPVPSGASTPAALIDNTSPHKVERDESSYGC